MTFSRPPWWINPALFVSVFTLPLFSIASLYAAESLPLNRIYGNYIDVVTVCAGLSSIASVGLGSAIAIWGPTPVAHQALVLERGSVIRALTFFGLVAILAQLLLFSALVTKVDLVVRAFSGERNATNELQNALGRIPGVTSLVQWRGLFFALLAATFLDRKFRLPPHVIVMAAMLGFMTVVYGFVASERVAIIEAAVTAFLTPTAFLMRPSVVRSTAPLIGAVCLFSLFSWGEYFRSWPWFRGTGISFLEFALTRFAGYFSSSINNGAGYFLQTDHPFYPYMSAIWFYKFPAWPLLDVDVGMQPLQHLDIFLTRFASLEFNNYSGVYAVLQDFGWPLGCAILFLFGVVGGALYRNFSKRGLFGLLLYPIWIFGYFDIIRIFYWGEPRFAPNFFGAIALWAYLSASSKKQPFFPMPAPARNPQGA